jgi:hypothetical protein
LIIEEEAGGREIKSILQALSLANSYYWYMCVCKKEKQ